VNITAHTDSQSETAKVGAANEASTDRPEVRNVWKKKLGWTIIFDY